MTTVSEQLKDLSDNHQARLANAIHAANKAFQESLGNSNPDLHVRGLVFHDNNPGPGGPPPCHFCPVVFPNGQPGMVCCSQ